MPELIQILQHNAIRELRMDRAPVNALDDALCAALLKALQAASDDHVAGVVLSGSPRVFTGGLDVPHLLSHGEDRDALHATWSAFFDVAKALASMPMPVAAAITGHAPAGGCVLALCCDYRVMTGSPVPEQPFLIGLNEVQVGLPVPDGIQHLMRRVIGHHQTERLVVPGTLINAEKAFQLGLVDELTKDAASTVERAQSWLKKMTQLPQPPMRKTRDIARTDIRTALDSIVLEDFLADWYQPATQAALKAMVARVKK